MTVAYFPRHAGRASSLGARFASPWLLVFAMLAAAVLWQVWIGLWGDVTWLLSLDERWFAGERPYVDFLEINPPASLLVYAPEVALAGVLKVSAESIVVAFGFALTCGSLALTSAILRRSGAIEEIGVVGVATALIVTLFLPADAFMERDVLAALFLLPFLALCEARARRVEIDWRLAAFAGVGVGLMATLKPPFGAVAALPFLYALWRAGPRMLIEAIEAPVALFVALVYAFVAFRYFPAYAQTMLPALIDVYLAVRQSAFELVHSEGGLDFLALMLTGLILARRRLAEPMLAVAALAAVGGFLGYFAQGKGWLYQAYPAIAFASLFAALAFERSQADDGDRRLAIFALLFALVLGLFIDRWGVPMALATVAAILHRRLFFGAPRDALASAARLAAAAALGASIAGGVPGSQPSDALGRALMRIAPHPTVMAITESFGFVHPMVRRLGAQWVQSVPNLIITSGARRLMDEHPGDAALAAKLAPFVEADRQRLIADIVTRRPEAIIVGPLNTRFHAAIWADPAVIAAMTDYRLFAVNDVKDKPGELWVRSDLVALRPSIEPEAPR